MQLDCHDTIAAVASPRGAGLRGIVRISGPDAIQCLARCFTTNDPALDWQSLSLPQRVPVNLVASSGLECDLYLWPTQCSYTRQPTGEIHTIGSPPILDTVLKELCSHGARLAEPGEFTLRAFLAGRIDLTQAEAVLGVIDAHGQDDFDTALAQLAGGLSQPLTALREQLLQVLTQLEAGLDFVEEDIEFISPQQLTERLQAVQASIRDIAQQMTVRNVSNELPRVVLTGLPNAGKSSLFNALVERYAVAVDTAEAITSPRPGTTRDYLTARIIVDGLTCELVDTAGEDSTAKLGSIDEAAQRISGEQGTLAALEIRCLETTKSDTEAMQTASNSILLLTKSDLAPGDLSQSLSCSSRTGQGLDELCHTIANRLASDWQSSGHVVAPTALRCAESVATADEALARALTLVASNSGEELIAAEVRIALTEIGRVVGVVYTDDILDRIFGQFCIGK